MTGYRVILAEDEKAARDFFKAVMEGETPEFTLIKSAVNGREGWEAVKELEPDVLVTDIRMPLMDGLELVERVHREYPRMITLVLSGYQEFDYARKAFTSGVEDYLLKPLNIEQYKEVMHRVRKILDQRKEVEELQFIRQLINREALPPSRKEFRNLRVRLAVIREGGLVSRFSGFSSPGEDRKREGIWEMAGRDRQERIFLVSADQLSGKEFTARLREQPQLQKGYRTICVRTNKFLLNDLTLRLNSLREILDRNIVLGRDSTIEEGTEKPADIRREWNKEQTDSMEYMLLNGDYGDIRRLLEERLMEWREKACPLITLESSLKEFLLLLNKNRQDISEEEVLLELYVSESRNYDELLNNVWSLTGSLLGLGESSVNRENLPEIFRGLCIYLENHYGENIRLNELAGYFGISSSYINRLFNRYFQCSFSDYMRKCRMDGAKRLMEINPAMAVQDVARYCGYEDPFYFSKVFKQETGMSPTQYKSEE